MWFFRMGYNSQHCLTVMIAKWCESVDKGCAFGEFIN